jgi:ElaA protein
VAEHSVRRSGFADLTVDALYDIVRLRNRVFALEQRVTAEDFDGRDREPDTEHWWVPGDGGAAAYLRLIRASAGEPHPVGMAPPAWVIGRVATDPSRRGEGLASALVRAVLAAHEGDPFVLHAQEYVAQLYAAAGFVPFGEPYDEASIRHVGMYLASAA